jgi:hypothetical protein
MIGLRSIAHSFAGCWLILSLRRRSDGGRRCCLLRRGGRALMLVLMRMGMRISEPMPGIGSFGSRMGLQKPAFDLLSVRTARGVKCGHWYVVSSPLSLYLDFHLRHNFH